MYDDQSLVTSIREAGYGLRASRVTPGNVNLLVNMAFSGFYYWRDLIIEANGFFDKRPLSFIKAIDLPRQAEPAQETRR